MTDRFQLVDALDAEFARVGAEAERSARNSPLTGRLLHGAGTRTLLVAMAIVVLLGGSAYAVPATRGTVSDVADSFASLFSGGDDDAPGRPLQAGDNVPAWFQDSAVGERRVIAETAGVKLFVRALDTERGRSLEFGLGGGIVMGGTLESWRERLGQHALVLLGTTAFGPRDLLDDRGRAPLLGVTTRDVSRVELRYVEGPPVTSDAGDGGFVLLADAWRQLRELVAYDDADRVLERVDVSDRDLRYLCEKEPVCPASPTRNAP